MIGTVSDVAPVLGENRAIARLGLERMRTAPRPGIAALLARAGVAPAAADLETVGFAIAPRLNAAGRVGEALDAARLLLAVDEAEAAELAARLEAANVTRRDLMRTSIAEARVALGLPDPAVAPGQEPLFPDLGPDARRGRRLRCGRARPRCSTDRGRSGSSGSSRAGSPTSAGGRRSSAPGSAT